MASTNFVDGQTVVVADWLNDVDAHVYDQSAVAHTATHISTTPTGNLSSTNVQAALVELQGDADSLAVNKANIAGQVFTGNITAPSITTDNLTTTSINSGQIAGMRNKVVNGKMEVHQVGGSIALAAGTAYYTVDQWVVSNLTGAALTATQENSPPSGSTFKKNLRITVNTADTSISSSEVCTIYQPIEGYNISDLFGTTFTVSFSVKSPKTGVHCVALSNGTNTRSYVAEYTVNAANTWETKTITISGGLPSSGTWDTENGNGLSLAFTLAAGTTKQTTPNTWNVGSFYATVNQVNCLDTVGAVFDLTGVQLEVGSVATPFEHRPRAFEEILCWRYFERGASVHIGPCTNGQAFGIPIAFKTRKRATPTVNYVSGTVSSSVGTAGILAGNPQLDCMTFNVTANVTGQALVSLLYEANARF